MKYVILVGAGGFARELLWLIREINRQQNRLEHQSPSIQVLGFVADDGKLASELSGLPVLGNDEWVLENLDPSVCFVPAVGDPEKRKLISEKYLQAGFRALRLVHPSVLMAEDVVLGQGCILCAGVVLTTNIKVGNFVSVNLNTTVGHDSILGDFSVIHPGVNISGNVELEDLVEIGTGSSLIQGVKIDTKVCVGAGSVVTKNLGEGKTYVGVPARVLE